MRSQSSPARQGEGCFFKPGGSSTRLPESQLSRREPLRGDRFNVGWQELNQARTPKALPVLPSKEHPVPESGQKVSLTFTT